MASSLSVFHLFDHQARLSLARSYGPSCSALACLLYSHSPPPVNGRAADETSNLYSHSPPPLMVGQPMRQVTNRLPFVGKIPTVPCALWSSDVDVGCLAIGVPSGTPWLIKGVRACHIGGYPNGLIQHGSMCSVCIPELMRLIAFGIVHRGGTAVFVGPLPVLHFAPPTLAI